MPEQFDPYYKWLGIRPDDRPISYYRLLGVDNDEDDPETIRSAADRTMAYVRSFRQGSHAAESERILGELSRALKVLLDPQLRVRYDQAFECHLAKSRRRDDTGSEQLATDQSGADQHAADTQPLARSAAVAFSGISRSGDPSRLPNASAAEHVRPVPPEPLGMGHGEESWDMAAGEPSMTISVNAGPTRGELRSRRKRSNSPEWLLPIGIAFGVGVIALVWLASVGGSSTGKSQKHSDSRSPSKSIRRSFRSDTSPTIRTPPRRSGTLPVNPNVVWPGAQEGQTSKPAKNSNKRRKSPEDQSALERSSDQ